jgi:hypothetical protein
MKRMGSNPPRLTLFIAGSTQSNPLRLLAPYNTPPTALFREVSEKIKADFSPTNQAPRPKPEFRSSAKQEDYIKLS